MTAETCDPRHMGGVRSRQPVRRDAVVEAEGVEADLERTEMQSSVSLGVAGCRRLVDEQRRGTVAASLHENRLRQLKHEVRRRLTWLVRQTRHDATLARLVPGHSVHCQL